jgi:hypothetical protein
MKRPCPIAVRKRSSAGRAAARSLHTGAAIAPIGSASANATAAPPHARRRRRAPTREFR